MDNEETPQVTRPVDMTSASRQQKNPVAQFLAGIAVIIVVVIVGMYLYTKSQVRSLSEAPFVVRAADIFNVPIAKIDGNSVLYTEFLTDYRSLKRFYENQPDGAPVPSDTEVQQQVLSRLMINELIADLADQYDITVEESDMAGAKSELLSQFPDQETAATEINNTFGWSLETFTERVIRPIVIEQKVSEAFATDDSVDDTYKATQVKGSHILFVAKDGESNDAVKARAENVLERIKGGEDFGALAKEFGSDGTAEVGGDLGWIDRGMTVPSFEDVLFSLQAGELYEDVVETEFGYHIVRADEIRTVNDFPAYFQDRLSNANVKIYTDIANPFETAQQDANAALPATGEDEEPSIQDDGAMAPEVGTEPSSGAELAQ